MTIWYPWQQMSVYLTFQNFQVHFISYFCLHDIKLSLNIGLPTLFYSQFYYGFRKLDTKANRRSKT